MNRYQYEELLAKATRPDASDDDLFALGSWMQIYGSDYWNGECWDISAEGESTGSQLLYPISTDDDDEDYSRYEIR